MSMKKQALLIGINKYKILPELKYARQDAEAVADSLKKNYCFSDKEILLLTDDRPGLLEPTDRYIIHDHLEKLANQELDLFIFGFWGHGLFRNGQRYFCPLNVKKERTEIQGLPFDELQDLLARIHSKNTCMILDCCQTVHDRGEAETLTAADQNVIENAARDIVLRRKEQIPNFPSNVAILNSCKAGQCAYEWDERKHGLFTALLLDAMKKRSASVMQIASYISSNIEKTALELGKDQTPFYKIEGDIVLPVNTKQASSEPAPKPVPQSFEPDNPLAEILKKEKKIRLEHLQNQVIEAFNKGNLILAISKCEELLKENPNSAEANALLPVFKAKLENQKKEYQLKKERKLKVNMQAISIPGTEAGETKTITVNDVVVAFCWCPPGKFMMGSPKWEAGRSTNEAECIVTLTKGFWMMETEVTQKLWETVMGNNPSSYKGDYYPVEHVSWNDCQEFCKKIGLQLPTEAQWEYACRAESTTAYFWGNALNGDKANCDGSFPCGTTIQGKYIGKTTPVGSYQPNYWGLCDMHGNVWEWCADRYDDDPNSAQRSSWWIIGHKRVTDPVGPSDGAFRVYRGGSWTDGADDCRSARRDYNEPGFRKYNLGFRCVLNVSKTTK